MKKAEAALFFYYQSRLQKHPFNDQQSLRLFAGCGGFYKFCCGNSRFLTSSENIAQDFCREPNAEIKNLKVSLAYSSRKTQVCVLVSNKVFMDGGGILFPPRQCGAFG
jgi:hypothetical protein